MQVHKLCYSQINILAKIKAAVRFSIQCLCSSRATEKLMRLCSIMHGVLIANNMVAYKWSKCLNLKCEMFWLCFLKRPPYYFHWFCWSEQRAFHSQISPCPCDCWPLFLVLIFLLPLTPATLKYQWAAKPTYSFKRYFPWFIFCTCKFQMMVSEKDRHRDLTLSDLVGHSETSPTL